MIRQSKRQPGGSDGGFSLIEGMLAAVILATGLLGLASMQGFALGRNVDAHETTRVTNFAADILERVQFNRRNAIAYNGINTNVACTIDPTAQPMARGDCDQWRNLLTSGLAAGLGGLRGQVTATSVGPATPPFTLNQTRVVVTLTWTGAEGAGKIAKQRQMTVTTVVAPE